MENLSDHDVGNAESCISIGKSSASSDEISLAFSFYDQISADVPTYYDVRSEIYWEYKIPTIVISPPDDGPQYSEGIVFPDKSCVTCPSQVTLSTTIASVNVPVSPVPKKRTWSCGPRKSFWKRLTSIFTCCFPCKRCGRKDQAKITEE